MHNKAILVSAYSCEPNRGSEPGVGWDYVSEMSKFYKLIVLTRNDKKKELENEKLANVEFHYIKLPFFKKKSKYGFMALFHYYLWQVWLFFYVKKNISLDNIKLIHHITFVNSWMPSFLVFFNKKFVWGPIGEHPIMPAEYFYNLPPNYYFKDRFKVFVRSFFKYIDVFFRITKLKATSIICINNHVAKFFDVKKTTVIPAISIDSKRFLNYQNLKKEKTRTFNIYWAGNVIYWKGIDLVIDSFIKFSENKHDVKLNIIGNGSDLDRVRKKASKNSKINFMVKMNQIDLFSFISTQDLFFYPSFEGGGLIVLESMALGKPVLCLNFGGAGEMITNNYNGISLNYTNYKNAIEGFTEKLNMYYDHREKLSNHGKNSIILVEERFSVNSKINFFKRIYES